MADIDFGTGPGTGDNLPTALGKVQAGYKAADTKATSALSSATANTAAIASLQSATLPLYNNGTPISAGGTLPSAAVNTYVRVSGGVTISLPTVVNGSAIIIGNASTTQAATVNGVTLAAASLDAEPNLKFLGISGIWKRVYDAGGSSTPSQPTIGFTEASKGVTEGDTGTTPITFTVSRSSTSGAISQTYTFAHVTTNDADFNPAPTGGTLNFADGEASKTITYQIAGDTSVEGNETFTVSLGSAPSGYVLGQASVTATITNNDAAPATTYQDYAIVWNGNSVGQWLGEGVAPYDSSGNRLGGAVVRAYGTTDFINDEGAGSGVGGLQYLYDGDPATRFDRRGASTPAVAAGSFTTKTRPALLGFIATTSGGQGSGPAPHNTVKIYAFTSAQNPSGSVGEDYCIANGVLAFSGMIAELDVVPGQLYTVAPNQSGF